MLGKYLTIKEATQKTGVSRQTIYNWIEKGILPFIQVGRSRVMTLEDLLTADKLSQKDPRSNR